jgi:hypothetical protein
VNAEAAILGTTLGVHQTPGSNLDVVETENWRYLLPTLEPRHVRCLEPPDLSRLSALSELAGRVTVQGRPRPVRRLEAAWRAAGGADNVVFGSGGDHDLEPAPDLVVAFGRRARALLARSTAGDAADTGAVWYGEWRRLGLRRGDDDRREPGDGPSLWLRPPVGSVHAAAPSDDAVGIRFLRQGGFDRSPGGQGLHRKVLRRLLEHDAVRGRLLREATVRGGGSTLARELPAYLRDAAARAGVDLSGRRWAMTAPGRYRSKKVVFFVFDGADERLGHVIKMTRHPELNHRLENEWRGLRRLASAGIDGVPSPVFLDHHAGLAMLGQRALAGGALRPTLGPEGAAEAGAATAWLEELGAATRAQVPAAAAARALAVLVERFEELYRPPPEERVRVWDQVRAIEAHPAPFPLVFQHGDPGAWNAIATDGGGVAFLDWEAADPHGMPLWDLLYFLRSYGVGAARSAGTRDALDGFARAFVSGSELSDQLVTAVRSYGARIGLDPQLVAPLYHLCWVHRAVKEATRLPAGRLHTGHYVQLLRWGLADRDASGLRPILPLVGASEAARAG